MRGLGECPERPQNGKTDFVTGLISLYINRSFAWQSKQPKKAGKMWLHGKKAKELRFHKGEFAADCKTDCNRSLFPNSLSNVTLHPLSLRDGVYSSPFESGLSL